MNSGSNVFSMLPRYLICVDKSNAGILKGRIYIGKTKYDGRSFEDLPDLLMFIDDLCDSIKSPMNWTEKRSFHGEGRRSTDVNNAGEVLRAMRSLADSEERGEKATFILDIRLRKFSGWQGDVHCMETGNACQFQSELEFIRFLEKECNSISTTGDLEKNADDI